MRMLRTLRWRDDAGSMPMALLLTLVATSLSTVALPTVVTQTVSTRTTINRAHALQAARTGLEVGIAHVRAARTGEVGVRAALPCNEIAGQPGGEARTSYAVRFRYYLTEPTASPAPAAVGCTQGSGPVGAATPPYVELTATGSTLEATPTQRRLRAVYDLRLAPAAPTAAPTTAAPTTTAPAPTTGPTYGPEGETTPHARKIHSWAASSNSSVCIDAGSSSPPVGTLVKFRTCDFVATKDRAFKQFFFYRQNLQIATVGSILANRPLCLDAGASPAVNTALTLQTCVTPTPARQRWYHNNVYNIEMGSDSGSGLSGLCVNVQSPGTSGTGVVLGGGSNCNSATYNTRQTFGISPSVGPGQAGARPVDCTDEAGYPCDITQVFLHAGPGRCLDKYTSIMGNMECVQHPDPAKLRWNQLWRFPRAPDGTAGFAAPIYTVDTSGRKWCLTSAGSSRFPTQAACDPRNPAANQRFTRYTNTGNYNTMYRVVDSSGRCMTHPTDYTGSSDTSMVFIWSGAVYNYKIRFDSCLSKSQDPYDRETYNQPSWVKCQKWNAPAVLPTSLPTAAPSTPATTGAPATTAPTTAAPTAPGGSDGTAPGAYPTAPLRDLIEVPATD
ncbi:hypothetical protein GCM10010124_12720 [Pilimelia terevasa]|uniref:Ricin B lectin domain-containing protein n=1 Tax=Pilimelia terevasa TaxID=53372 RepID=A0A8J3BH48_9ACTN|nr:RICIN domain-containing protein [Pilimelia terevasa]GGK21685.1 hypothetical protein GCM10010124_12720 [Pilimelia terevasa]